jgi:hypothetical protein
MDLCLPHQLMIVRIQLEQMQGEGAVVVRLVRMWVALVVQVYWKRFGWKRPAFSLDNVDHPVSLLLPFSLALSF